MHGHHRGPETIFAERGILAGAVLVLVAYLLEQRIAQHTLALAVDKDNLASLGMPILVERLAHLVELIVEDVRIGESGRRVEQSRGVQVYLDDAGLVVVPGHRFAHRSVDLLLHLHESLEHADCTWQCHKCLYQYQVLSSRFLENEQRKDNLLNPLLQQIL